jgi:PST family polysaccharide transporter
MTERSTNSKSTGDSLATGLLFMLSLTVVQRLVGFGRSVYFCGVLEDDQLGRWSLGFSFLLLAAPLAVLGITGSFGRYVEYYRQRGQLGAFLRRTVTVSGLLAAAALVMLMLLDEQVAWLVFGDADQVHFVHVLVATLAAVIVFNFVIDLLTALRQIRAVAVMQFVSSFGFATFGVGLLLLTDLREEAVVMAYGAAALGAVIVGVVLSRRLCSGDLKQNEVLPHGQLWMRLLPFAAWVWMTNLLSNLFDAADRFMIVHLAADSVLSADSLVGQYHSSRVVPLLLVSVAGMVSGIILPYLSRDWESGRRRDVSELHGLSIKLTGLGFTAIAAGVLVAAPLLFSWLLRGKFDQGLAVLPWTLSYCVWFSITMIAQNYLWCAEKARLGSFALLLGLTANIALNALLLPYWGLLGAVVATTVANVIALLLVVRFSQMTGFQADAGVYLCCCLPVVLLLGALPAMAAVISFSFFAMRRGWLFSDDQWKVMSVAVEQRCQTLLDRFPWCSSMKVVLTVSPETTKLSDQI